MPARLVGLLGDPAFNARVAADVESGTLDAAVAAAVGPALAAELEAALGPGDAARAGEICAALGDGAAGFALRLWPKLKLILANATGAFEPRARRGRWQMFLRPARQPTALPSLGFCVVAKDSA